MGATFSTLTSSPSHVRRGSEEFAAAAKQREKYVFSYQYLTTGKDPKHPSEAPTRNMWSQHFHLMNTSTLKKLISSGTLNRPKKNSTKVRTVILEETIVKPVAPQEPVAPPRPLIPRPAFVEFVEDKENYKPKAKDQVVVLAPETELAEAARPTVKRTVLQASTSELLRCFGVFLHGRFRNLSGEFAPTDPMQWLRGLDRNLIAQGWQDVGFINPANVVFLYLLLRGLRMECAKSIRQLQAQVLTALYLSYSYMGHEISYPVKLFLYADDNKDDFWKRCLKLIDIHSGDMLRLNSDSAFFAKIFAELKSYGAPKPVQYLF